MHEKRLAPPMIFGGEFKGSDTGGIFLELNNIGWRIEQAQPDPNNPLLEPKYPWDSGIFGGHGTVLKDPIDGLFKAWVASIAVNPDYKNCGRQMHRLTYAFSEDGTKWIRPELDICPFKGYPRTNILFDFESGGTSTYASVFVDPENNTDEPYEMFVFRRPGLFGSPKEVKGFKNKPDGGGIYRYRSKDGLHWRGVEGPLTLETGDTLYVHKDKDGTNWSETIPILTPDWQDGPGDQIMELGYYPYGNGIIGIIAVYHAMTQRMDLQFAASSDGINWWRPGPRQACLSQAPLGDYGGGLIWPTKTLVEDGDKLYLYYAATESLHGDIYSKTPSGYDDYGAFCRVSWEKGRMWAAVPSSGGDLTATLVVYPNRPAGKTLYLNGVTIKDGDIRAELLDASSEHWNQAVERVPALVLEGFSKDNCIPFKGNHKCTALQWQNKKAGDVSGEVCLKLYLRKARLYGFEWR